MTRDLILVGQIGYEVFTIIFNDKNCNVLKVSLVVEKGMKMGILYLFIGHIFPPTIIVIKKNQCSRIIVAVKQEEHQIVV